MAVHSEVKEYPLRSLWFDEEWGLIDRCPFVNSTTAKAFHEHDPPLMTCGEVCQFFGINSDNAATILEEAPAFNLICKNMRQCLGVSANYKKILERLLRKLIARGDPPTPPP